MKEDDIRQELAQYSKLQFRSNGTDAIKEPVGVLNGLKHNWGDTQNVLRAISKLEVILSNLRKELRFLEKEREGLLNKNMEF